MEKNLLRRPTVDFHIGNAMVREEASRVSPGKKMKSYIYLEFRRTSAQYFGS